MIGKHSSVIESHHDMVRNRVVPIFSEIEVMGVIPRPGEHSGGSSKKGWS